MQPWTMSTESLLFAGAVMVLISIAASRAFDRLGAPALLIFLAIGMLAGSEGPVGLHFDDPATARSIGVIALSLILFSGGLDTRWRDVKPVLWKGIGLSTVGVAGTAAFIGLFAVVATPFSLIEGLLLGSIVSSTDAAAVFAVLRSKSIRLRGKLRPLLELESGSNDPMAVFLTLAVIGLLTDSSASLGALFPMFLQQMALGGLAGFAGGKAMAYVVNHLRLEYQGLYPVLTLAFVVFIYSATSLVNGNGFLAVYLAGIVMGNSDFVHKQSLMQFHDGLAWFMQITMFLTLGLLVFPSRILPVIGSGILVSAVLIFVARPLSVFATLAFSDLRMRERTLVAWVGLRGAVPIILATFPLLAGVEKAEMVFNLVFFIVITSALIQGISIPAVARWLRVDAPEQPDVPAIKVRPEPGCITCRLQEVRITDSSPLAGKQIAEAGIPPAVRILLLARDGAITTPTGSTILRPDDILLVTEEGDEQNAPFEGWTVLRSS